MLPIESNAVYTHTDKHGVAYGFRYLSPRLQQQYIALIKKWSETEKKLKKLSSPEGDIPDDTVYAVQEDMQNLNIELVSLFTVFIGEVDFRDGSAGVNEYLMDRPVGYLKYLVGIIFEIMPVLRGDEIEEEKNSSRLHSSDLKQKTDTTNASPVQKTEEKESDA